MHSATPCTNTDRLTKTNKQDARYAKHQMYHQASGLYLYTVGLAWCQPLCWIAIPTVAREQDKNDPTGNAGNEGFSFNVKVQVQGCVIVYCVSVLVC